jgi:hypothetical protein
VDVVSCLCWCASDTDHGGYASECTAVI